MDLALLDPRSISITVGSCKTMNFKKNFYASTAVAEAAAEVEAAVVVLL